MSDEYIVPVVSYAAHVREEVFTPAECQPYRASVGAARDPIGKSPGRGRSPPKIARLSPYGPKHITSRNPIEFLPSEPQTDLDSKVPDTGTKFGPPEGGGRKPPLWMDSQATAI